MFLLALGDCGEVARPQFFPDAVFASGIDCLSKEYGSPFSGDAQLGSGEIIPK
jgi:hypothetical protein